MIPLKDDNPISSRPIVTYFIIGMCVVVFFMQLGSESYRTGQLFYSYGLIPSVLMGHDQLPMDLYAVPAYVTIFSSMFMHGGFMHLIGNMLYMWIFADNIEDSLGPKNFIIGMCVVVFFMQLGSESYRTGQLFYSYGLIPSVLMGHDQLPMDLYAVPAYMTIFSSMFMHGGWMHLIGNMWYMKIFADNIEDNLGSRNFIIFYILCGIGAAIAQVLADTHSQIPMVGASGAIGGVLGAYMINHPKAKVLVLIPYFIITIIKIRALYVLGFWFILQFISSGEGVAYAAHIGGFVTGIVLILFFNKKVIRKTKVIKGPWG